jgi:arabinose-5-phosphate isomerase
MKSLTDIQILQEASLVLQSESDALKAAQNRLGKEFSDAVRLILELQDGARVVVMGMGKSGHVGRKIAATLASTGTPSMFVHPAEAGHGDLGMVTNHDIVLGISYSGTSDELLRTIPFFKRNSIPVIGMTAQHASPLAKASHIVIDTSVDREACPLGLAPTSSTTLTMALGDALAMALVVARGFTADMFAATHPHGALGRRLLITVADVMLMNKNIPISQAADSVRAVLVEMSRGGVGFTNVVDGDKVIGIYTDGDLRRTLDSDIDIRSTKVADVVRRDFVSIGPEALAVEAVDIMERRKITSMPVLDSEGRLIGSLNMRLLLQACVV